MHNLKKSNAFLRNRKVHIHITCATSMLLRLRNCRRFQRVAKRRNDICMFNVADLSHIEPLRTSRAQSEGECQKPRSTKSIIKYLFYACAFPWVMACQSISAAIFRIVHMLVMDSHMHACSRCQCGSRKDDDEYFMHFKLLNLTLHLMHIWYADLQHTHTHTHIGLRVTLDGQWLRTKKCKLKPTIYCKSDNSSPKQVH